MVRQAVIHVVLCLALVAALPAVPVLGQADDTTTDTGVGVLGADTVVLREPFETESPWMGIGSDETGENALADGSLFSSYIVGPGNIWTDLELPAPASVVRVEVVVDVDDAAGSAAGPACGSRARTASLPCGRRECRGLVAGPAHRWSAAGGRHGEPGGHRATRQTRDRGHRVCCGARGGGRPRDHVGEWPYGGDQLSDTRDPGRAVRQRRLAGRDGRPGGCRHVRRPRGLDRCGLRSSTLRSRSRATERVTWCAIVRRRLVLVVALCRVGSRRSMETLQR